jgi:hypothetical protein
MTKVGFIEELKSGEMIIVPARGPEFVRFTGQTVDVGFGETSDRPSDKLLRKLIALRGQDKKD